MASLQSAPRLSISGSPQRMPSIAANAITGATSPPPPRQRSDKYDHRPSTQSQLTRTVSPSSGSTNSNLPEFKSSRSAKVATDPVSRDNDLNTKWTEMQNTLEEVELNAESGRNAFNSDHAFALEELRKAQIQLAQAWARSEADDEYGNGTGANDLVDGQYSAGDGLGQAGIIGGRSGDDGKSRIRGHSTADQKTKLEQETENDIQLARKRREANDRYFERVNKGVVDVVKKLEIVAAKMKDVEAEAQDIWDDRDSGDSESLMD